MSRSPRACAQALALVFISSLCLAACGQPSSSGLRSPGEHPSPSIPPRPPLRVALRHPAEAILSDQAVGSPRRSGRDHLSAAEAASLQPDQGAAIDQFVAWGWLEGSIRTWANADETLVLTARPEGAAQAADSWAADAGRPPFRSSSCSDTALAGLDDCRLATAGDRAIVVGRLGAAVFRLACPAAAAERLTAAQAVALHA
jgi:hypothetical protein